MINSWLSLVMQLVIHARGMLLKFKMYLGIEKLEANGKKAC